MDTSIFDHSPWLVSEKRFVTVRDEKTILSLLQTAKDNHSFLTLCDNKLNLHFKSVLIRIDATTLQIDKPIEWEGNREGFQLFFQDAYGNWNMVKSQIINEGLYDLTVPLPDTLYRLKSRGNPRIGRIEEATASFLSGNCNLGDLQIVNLSRSGMLVCGSLQDQCLPVDSIINDISISLPLKKFNKPAAHIDAGRVVRAFQRMDSNQTCHAISFVRANESTPLELNGFLPKE